MAAEAPPPGVAPAGHVQSTPPKSVPPAQKAEPAKAEPARGGSSLRTQAERLDDLVDRVGELVIAQVRLTQFDAEFQRH